MIRFFSVCLFFIISVSSTAQSEINSYKYLIVPNQFEFQKSAGQYDLNELTKFLFNKEGFHVLMSTDRYPDDLVGNPCMALKAKVRNESGWLVTKVAIDLVDCYNTVVYTSPSGTSKIKDYKRGYQDAIRKAFVGVQAMSYEYDGSIRSNLNVKVEKKPVVKEPVVVAEKTEVAPKAVVVVQQEVKEAPVSKTKVEAEVQEPQKVEETAEVTQKEVKKEKEVKEQKEPKQVSVKNEEVAKAAVVAAPIVVEDAQKTPVKEKKTFKIEGRYKIDVWGTCSIEKKGDGYVIVGGDENFEFAKIFTTSKPNLFMVKKTGFSQTQLLELDENGNLMIDTKDGIKVYKRVD